MTTQLFAAMVTVTTSTDQKQIEIGIFEDCNLAFSMALEIKVGILNLGLPAVQEVTVYTAPLVVGERLTVRDVLDEMGIDPDDNEEDWMHKDGEND